MLLNKFLAFYLTIFQLYWNMRLMSFHLLRSYRLLRYTIPDEFAGSYEIMQMKIPLQIFRVKCINYAIVWWTRRQMSCSQNFSEKVKYEIRNFALCYRGEFNSVYLGRMDGDSRVGTVTECTWQFENTRNLIS